MTKSATRVAADKVTFTQTEVTSAITAGDTAARAGRKNFILNGGFDVWQRGTSLTAASSYLADRWVNGTSEAQSRQAFTVGQTEVDGNPTYYHRSGGGGSAYYGLDHKIENVGTLSGKEVTLSYWMKGSSAFTNAPYRSQNFGSGGSSGVEAALSTSSITTSWVRYTHTFTFPSISGKTVGASSFSQLNVFRANIANIVVDIANVQLELGSVATDFEHRSYQEELLLCEWYFKKWLRSDARMTDSDSRATYTGIAKAVNEAFFYMPFNMRVIPTSSYNDVALHDAVGSVIDAVGSTAYNAMGSFRIIVTNGLTTGDILYIRWKSAASFIQFDAEL